METKTPKSTYEILVAADALLSDESKWTKGELQRDKDGNKCSWSKAVCFCGFGAISQITGENDYEKWDEITDFLSDVSKDEHGLVYSVYQDRPSTTFQDVKAVFAKAIEAAKADEVTT